MEKGGRKKERSRAGAGKEKTKAKEILVILNPIYLLIGLNEYSITHWTNQEGNNDTKYSHM